MPEQSTPPLGPVILYGDDDRANRVVFEQSLAGDFDIVCVADGASALAEFDRRDVAVLVTDMRMPTMSGEQLIRIVKERHPRTICMVVTAFADVEPILRAINEGLVARYLLKPWVYSELVQVLRWGLEAWKFSRDSEALGRRLLQTERLATLGSISGMLVHDLREPLMSLTMNLSHIGELAASSAQLGQALEGSAPPSPARDRLIDLLDDFPQLADDLSRSAQHLHSLINNLREFMRTRKPAGGAAPADPVPVLRHAMSVCQELVVHVGASMDYRGPKELPRVRMPTTALTQVLINLLANGAQALGGRTGSGGVLSIEAKSGDGVVEICVRDNGVGMTPEVLARVGTPFFTTRSDGIGLGFAQCQRLVGAAGGRLHLQSEAGVGTSVTIALPIAR